MERAGQGRPTGIRTPTAAARLVTNQAVRVFTARASTQTRQVTDQTGQPEAEVCRTNARRVQSASGSAGDSYTGSSLCATLNAFS